MIALSVDQVTKATALANAPRLAERLEVLPVFNLVLVHNRGVSFGMFGFLPWWTLTVGGAVIVAILLIVLWRERDFATGAGLGLIIGGASGNLIDRIRYHAVTDFLDFHVAAHHWPAFNMADVAIFAGVAVLLLKTVRTNMGSNQVRK